MKRVRGFTERQTLYIQDLLRDCSGDEQAEEVREILNQWAKEGVLGGWAASWAISTLHTIRKMLPKSP